MLVEKTHEHRNLRPKVFNRPYTAPPTLANSESQFYTTPTGGRESIVFSTSNSRSFSKCIRDRVARNKLKYGGLTYCRT